MALITYTDKSTMNENADVPAINKVQASDMNEIKSVVNSNWNALGDHIVESGTNYIKYDSGTMVQWGALEVTSAIQTAMGSVYRTASAQTKTFPVEFINNTYYVTTTALSALNSFYITGRNKENFSGYPICYVSTASGTRYVQYIAIGKWK